MKQLINQTTGKMVLTRLHYRRNPIGKLLGLLGRTSLASSTGLLIENCSKIHTMGMRFPIDVYFIDQKGYILKIVYGVQRNRISVSCLFAQSVLECQADTLQIDDLLVGDLIHIQTSAAFTAQNFAHS